ncbi:protein cbp-1-like [Schistocerca serialis cubense]|uniref:protein cbp-1-like n=1 Tax=Schistocerca serialis cubense TaxID=2023355 RepID=UPI00214F19A9|nr:protein cbp-1-like [Schistocerca serialis cubense]
MSMRNELHNQAQSAFGCTCSNCKDHVETRYHCNVCDDFDLCVQCYEKNGHPHSMEKRGMDDDISYSNLKKAYPQEARKLSIKRCIQKLVHACQCHNVNCCQPGCQKMKRVVRHTKVCKSKTKGGCSVCKQLVAIGCYHSKHCQIHIHSYILTRKKRKTLSGERKIQLLQSTAAVQRAGERFSLSSYNKPLRKRRGCAERLKIGQPSYMEPKCSVPFCPNIKHTLKQHKIQQVDNLQRRMAAMNIRTTVPVGLLPGSSGVLGVGGAGSAVTPVGDFTPATSGAGIWVGLQPSHRSDISGLKPDAQTPSAHCEIDMQIED